MLLTFYYYVILCYTACTFRQALSGKEHPMSRAIEYGLATIFVVVSVAVLVGDNLKQTPPPAATESFSSQLAAEVQGNQITQLGIGQTTEIVCQGGTLDASMGSGGTTITATCDLVRARPLPPSNQ